MQYSVTMYLLLMIKLIHQIKTLMNVNPVRATNFSTSFPVLSFQILLLDSLIVFPFKHHRTALERGGYTLNTKIIKHSKLFTFTKLVKRKVRLCIVQVSPSVDESSMIIGILKKTLRRCSDIDIDIYIDINV